MNTRDRLAEALEPHMPHTLGCRAHREASPENRCVCISGRAGRIEHIAEALLPVAEAIAVERAKAELLAAADIPLKACCPEHASKRLRARAAGLTDKDGQR